MNHKTSASQLSRSRLHEDPIRQFEQWFQQAAQIETADPEAMTLATVSADGKPSARMVLLRGFDSRGFSFFTNYGSRKAQEIAANPSAAIVFYWHLSSRQVRIEGCIKQLDKKESDRYYASRPRGSQVGAWTSNQSQPIQSRRTLEKAYQKNLAKFQGENIPRPDFWGGFRLVPARFEFWQGRENRLHDRFVYSAYSNEENTGWQIQRLAP